MIVRHSQILILPLPTGLSLATVIGGCDPQLSYGQPVAPDACGGSVTVDFIITDYCLATPLTGSATFTVPAPAQITYNFPGSMTADDCETQADINVAFANWLSLATVIGGCDPQLAYGQPVAPDACGGSVTVDFIITDYCLATPLTGSATFTVPAPAQITYNFPSSMTADDCETQSDIDLAFANWLSQATVSIGGCDPQLSYGQPVAPDACGGSVTVDFIITDYCLATPLTGSATFTVPAPAQITYNFPGSMTADDCETQADINVAFANWLSLATVIGGCDPQLAYGQPVAPDACGGSVTVDFIITDYCLATPLTGSATFTVPAPAQITYNFPVSMTADDCETQSDIDLAFANWLSQATVSGGCDPQLAYGQPVAPDACGGSVTVDFIITDYCLATPLTGSATFTVPAPAQITYNFPGSMTADDCETQSDIDLAFANWLSQATVSGGCDPQLSYGQPVAPDACGGSVTVDFIITDYCLATPLTGSATFTVPAPAQITYNFPVQHDS
jgi:hypothetical protein